MSQPLIAIEKILEAGLRLRTVALHTPLMFSQNLSAHYHAEIYLKREDLQVVRSYKIRGAYNKIASLPPAEMAKGVVCASAGNHAQGVAMACQSLGIPGRIFMPTTTPKQKINKVRSFGKSFIEIILIGDNFDEANAEAMLQAQQRDQPFIHPFDDLQVIAGQGTVGMEILNDSDSPIDYLFVPIGGGGLMAGVGSYFKQLSPKTKIIGLEPAGAPAMHAALKQGRVVTLEHIDRFVDGAAVKKVGDLAFQITLQVIEELILIPEGKICTTILKMYNEDAIVVEPAGAMAVSALEYYRDHIKGKRVVCLISGGNNDITRTEEIKEKSLLAEGLKHYFIIRFPQRAGALR